jgi:hypothetical protein
LPHCRQDARTARTILGALPEETIEMMNIAQAPHGINVVVETEGAVYIGRLGKLRGDQVKMHHVAVFPVGHGEDAEELIRQTAKYGVPVQHVELAFQNQGIQRIRKLGDVPKA